MNKCNRVFISPKEPRCPLGLGLGHTTAPPGHKTGSGDKARGEHNGINNVQSRGRNG